MKKFLVLFAIAFLTLGSLAACAPEAEVEEEPTGYEIALVTDIGTIDDKSFNQGAWEGVVEYAEEKGLTYQYYQPAAASTADYVEAITLAVEGGAKIIVTPGFMFAGAIFEAQTMYPEVNFVLLDADPHTDDYATFKIEMNVYSIYYAEEQSGYLAGFAAVKDGFTNLGFMGGMAVPAVVRFGHGFVQGAEAAAVELGVDVTIKYEYLNSFAPDDNHKVKALGWYSEGVEAIFVAAGGAGLSVMAAAEEADTKVIGVDVDQSNLSETVITSAMKGLTTSVYGALADYYAGSFKGGVIDTLDVTKDGVGLPLDFSRFSTFTQADYDAVYAKLVSGEVVVVKDALKVGDLPVTKTTVTLLGTE
jgi:basic membrane protein A and related proteins